MAVLALILIQFFQFNFVKDDLQNIIQVEGGRKYKQNDTQVQHRDMFKKDACNHQYVGGNKNVHLNFSEFFRIEFPR